MSQRPAAEAPATAPSILDLARCIGCGARLDGEPSCPRCRRQTRSATASSRRSARSRAATGSPRRSTTARAGGDSAAGSRASSCSRAGVRRARMQILRHVLEVDRPDALGLEVGIGDGENLPSCRRAGPSTASTSPGRGSRQCLARHPVDGRPPRLGRGRDAPLRRRDVRRLLDRRRVQLLPRPRGGPARDAPGDPARRAGGRRRRGPRPPSRRARPPDRRPGASTPGGSGCWGSTGSSSRWS